MHTPTRSPGLFSLGALLVVLQAVMLSACGPGEGTGAEEDTGAQQSTNDAGGPSDEQTAGTARDPGVAEIVQGGENPDLRDERGPIVTDEPVLDDDAPSGGTPQDADAAVEAAEEDAGGETALSDLPGFVPAIREGDALADDESEPVRAIPDDAPVMIAVRLIELLTDDEVALTPLRGFLSGEEAGSLNPAEVAALDEMLGVLRDSGVVGQVNAPRIQVTAGESADVQILQVGPAGNAGESVLMSLAPTLRPADENGARLVELRYDFESSKAAESTIEVLATGLGLDIGPRARVAGTAVVSSRETFYLVRRFSGGSFERELLILVRADVLPGALNK